MKTFSPNFHAAAHDYLYLLNRNYPQFTLIKLVGDRYQLSGVERSMLYRGVSSSVDAAKRRSKLINNLSSDLEPLSIDACNVLITLGSYLNGNIVFISNDDFLRDASEIHGKVFRTSLIERSLDLVFKYLLHHGIKNVRFYIDSPISFSGKLCERINHTLSELDMEGFAQTHTSPDHILKNLNEGILATSDSVIIDITPLPVIDLPKNILEFHFHPGFVDLGTLFTEV